MKKTSLTRLITSSFLFLLILFILLANGCFFNWEKNIKKNDLHFSKLRQDGKSRTWVGFISENQKVNQYFCKAGWIHFYSDWELKACTLAKKINFNGNEIPADSWISFRKNGEISVAFPENTLVQSYLCRGTGGCKGAQVSFYKTGKLKYFFAEEPVVIDGISCKASIFHLIGLHENGKLKKCTLEKDSLINSIIYKRGQVIELDSEGIVITNK